MLDSDDSVTFILEVSSFTDFLLFFLDSFLDFSIKDLYSFSVKDFTGRSPLPNSLTLNNIVPSSNSSILNLYLTLPTVTVSEEVLIGLPLSCISSVLAYFDFLLFCILSGVIESLALSTVSVSFAVSLTFSVRSCSSSVLASILAFADFTISDKVSTIELSFILSSTKDFISLITATVAPVKSPFLILSTISDAFCFASSLVGNLSPSSSLKDFSLSSIFCDAPGETLSKYFFVKFVPFPICVLKKLDNFCAGSDCTTSCAASFTPCSLTVCTACPTPLATALTPLVTASVALCIIPGLSFSFCLPSVVNSPNCSGVNPIEDFFTLVLSFVSLPNFTVAKFCIRSLNS